MRSVPNPFHQGRTKRTDPNSLMALLLKVVICGGAWGFLLMNIMLLLGVNIHTPSLESTESDHPNIRQTQVKKSSESCSFRQYPPRRYYGLQKLEQPDFLSQVEYVYGKLPMMLIPDQEILDYRDQGKLCVDQSEWLPPEKNDPTKELPFADGTNPSILSLDRLESSYPELVKKWKSLGGSFIATVCMTDSQCSYQDTPDEQRDFKLSRDEKATVVHTVLLVLDDRFRSLLQTTIYLERDAPWGRRFKKAAPMDTTNNNNNNNQQQGGFQLLTRALDDARLFIHLQKLWVSYRDGPSWGYEDQVLNEIHLELASASSGGDLGMFTATLKASESVSFCCGRNMALMEHLDDPTQLQSLTWADPVTVVDVDDGRKTKTQTERRLEEKPPVKRKSHFHGTNAFMVYLPDRDEFFGIGHFHRPSGRDAFNPYARFGHHYTHTFFTINSQPPFRLTRLSQEFVLPSKSKILQDDDADIIQFLSGLEVVKRDGKDYAVIAYGINDCEAAAVYLDMHRVNELLLPVEQGKEVVDLMKPIEK